MFFSELSDLQSESIAGGAKYNNSKTFQKTFSFTVDDVEKGGELEVSPGSRGGSLNQIVDNSDYRFSNTFAGNNNKINNIPISITGL